jgi:hypothetical protein
MKGYVIDSSGKVLYRYDLPDDSPPPLLKAGERRVDDPDLAKAEPGDTVTLDSGGRIASVAKPSPPPRAETREEKAARLEAAIDAAPVDKAMLKKLVREIVLGEKVLR